MKHLGKPETKREIVGRLARLHPHESPRWGRMTAGQMLCHLRDSYHAATGDKAVSMATGLFQRTFMKWGGLYLPFEWPKNLQTRPEMAQEKGGTPPGDFEQDRKQLVATIERFTATGRDFQWHPHPLFGPMSERDWLRWGYLHADHHLRQFGQ